MYATVKPDEDGEVFGFVDGTRYVEDGRLNVDLLMEDYGIKKWVDQEDVENEHGVQYWGEGRAMLLRVEVLKPRPEKVIERWTV